MCTVLGASPQNDRRQASTEVGTTGVVLQLSGAETGLPPGCRGSRDQCGVARLGMDFKGRARVFADALGTECEAERGVDSECGP